MNLANIFSGGQNNKASDLLERQIAQVNGIKEPSAAQLTLPQLQRFVEAGILTPEEAQAYLVDSNAYDSTSATNAGMESELSALGELQNIINAGGDDAQSQANVQKILNQVATSTKGNNEAIMRDAARTGTANSGFTLASKLASGQNDATIANQNALDQAAAAEARNMEAVKQKGALGGNVQQQQYLQEQNKANAANAIAQFNAQQQQSTENLNTTTANAAKATNLANAQDISNKNTQVAQTEQASIPAAQQAAFDNALKKAGVGMEGVKAAADQASQAGQQNAGILGGLIGTAGTIGSAYLSKNPYAALATSLADKQKQDQQTKAASGGRIMPGGGVQGTVNMEAGGEVPGKAPLPGDHPANDMVNAKLSPDEIVLPRTVAIPAMQGDMTKVLDFLRSLPKPQERGGLHPKAVLDTLRALNEHHNQGVAA